MPDIENNLKKYEQVISIWKRWDESYWTSVYVFILVLGLMFAGFSQIYDKSKIIALIFCITGVLISLIWMLILHKKLAHIYIAESEGRIFEMMLFSNTKFNGCFALNKKYSENQLPEISNIFKWRKILTEFSSGFLVSFVLPLIFIAIWSVIFLITLVLWIICDLLPCISSIC